MDYISGYKHKHKLHHCTHDLSYLHDAALIFTGETHEEPLKWKPPLRGLPETLQTILLVNV